MHLDRLLNPRSVAVVGASQRVGTYGNQTLANLVEAGFAGPVWGVHPTATTVHGVRCVPTLADLPEVPDVAVIATPAATVPGLIAEAGELGVGAAVVYAAGFAEVAHGRGLQQELRDVALRYNLPVCGPNGNGIVALHRRAPLWGDAYHLGDPGAVALISQSGNVTVNALGTRRGLRLHTVVSCGNQAVLDAADYLEAVADIDGVRSVALYLEADGDGRRLTLALQACAERQIGVAVLKAGRSALGASSAAAHTGAVAGDARILQALVEEAGAAWVDDPHDLLETAKSMAVATRRTGGLGIVTCSGGDAATGADVATALGIDLPPLHPDTVSALEGLVPAAATIGNPLDYTALIWGDVELIANIVATTGDDPGLGQVVAYYDQPQDMDPASADEWERTLDGIALGAQRSTAGVVVASTLPDTLPEPDVLRLLDQGVPAVWGLRTGLVVADALRRPAGDPRRLAQIATAADGRTQPGRWLAEHEAKSLLQAHGIPVPDGRVVIDVDDAVSVADGIGYPVAAKLSAPDLQHKSDIGALALGLSDAAAVRDAYSRLRRVPGHERDDVLVEAMAQPGVELLVAAHRDGVVPALVVALGGIWVEVVSDAAVVPLPAAPERVERALRGLRTAAVLTGGRGGVAVDLAAVSHLAAAVGDLLIRERLALVELNPVIATADGAVAADAVVRRQHCVRVDQGEDVVLE